MSIWKYLVQRKGVLLMLLCCCAVFGIVFGLYHLPLEAVAYPSVLCGCILLAAGIADFLRQRRRHRTLSALNSLVDIQVNSLPKAKTPVEEDYQHLLHLCSQEHSCWSALAQRRYQDMMDYYTVWAHQIKTPIAAMRLHLQQEDTPLSRTLTSEVLRVEQYADMVLAYLRLDADSTDYVIHSCDLDDIVRKALKRFAGEFIARKLTVSYQLLNAKVISDEKWLLFVVEQVLSNALKYTVAGGVTITLEEPKTLCIADTGMGIAPEDLPRIFEQGYTGAAGRRDTRASGIGLYLCKRICANLGHGISAESVLGRGTAIRIDLCQKHVDIE